MSIKEKTKSKLKIVLSSVLFGIVIGPLFVCVAFGFEIERFIKGLIAGFLITFFISSFEKFIYEARLRKLNFSLVLFVRTLYYIVVISISVIMVWVIHESLINSRSLFNTVLTDDFRHFLIKGDFPTILLFSVVVSFIGNFFLQINDLLGRGVLLRYISGKYHKPIVEERFFMFLDLESSTTIAEKIGLVKYHNFMNAFFFDISEPIAESKGEIYQYVGDEVVISWKKESGIMNSNCIKCYFKISEKINSLRNKYINGFGLLPGFKAGVHFGEVVTGEIGDSRKDIVFHGDVMNTASRIQGQAKILNKQLLVSEQALCMIKLDGIYKSEKMGKFKLKGKEQETEIYSIETLW